MKAVDYHNHILIIAALVFAALVVDMTGIDLLVADALFQLEHHQWGLRNHYITETLLHRGGRKLIVLSTIIILVLAVASHKLDRLINYRRQLWFLFLCLITAPALVAIAKVSTHMDCPWDLELFGGHYPYVHLLQSHPHTWRYGQCFPGGHSSGGFALIALYFFASELKPEWRYKGLITGLATGMFFGATQQLRGAHFLSHDLWSLAICWMTCLFYQYALFSRDVSETDP